METPNIQTVSGWFAGRVPESWFTAAPEVAIDGDQIVVVGSMEASNLAADATAEAKAGAAEGRIARFREETRPYRIAIALEAERLFKLHVQWGAKVGDTRILFNKGGSGRGEGKEGEARGVVVGRRRGMMRAWRRRFGPRPPFGPGFGWYGPRWGRPGPTGDVQDF
jgi:hypothetical protein